jgi:hypothetical protein
MWKGWNIFFSSEKLDVTVSNFTPFPVINLANIGLNDYS